MNYSTKGYKISFFQEFSYFFDLQITSFKALIETSDSLIKKIERKQYRKFKDKFDDEYLVSEFYETRDRLFRISNINRNSIFLSQFSFFEHSYKMLCERIQEAMNNKIKINDLSGDEKIDKFRKYLQKVVEIEMTQSDNNWQKISDFRKIRNSIAHNGSIAVKTDVIKIVKNNPDFDFAETSMEFAIKSKKYLLDFNSTISDYFKCLCIALDKKLLNN